MFNIGGWEFLVILVVALLFLGPERLPGAAKQAGKTLGTLREMAQSFQTELEQAVNDPIEAGARLAGDQAVKESASAKAAPDTPESGIAEPGAPEAGSSESGQAGSSRPTNQAAATAAHVAATQPDRTEKPVSAAMSAADQPADVVPDPANLEFGSAAPRYPAPDQFEEPATTEAAVESQPDETGSAEAGQTVTSPAESGPAESGAAESSPADTAAVAHVVTEGAGD